MRLLGLSAGASPTGSVEIALKRALAAAQATGVEVELIRLRELELSAGPSAGPDDAAWFWEKLLASDGLIVATPVYSRTIPGLLRLLADKFSGPQADVAFTREILAARAAGTPLAVDFAVDERILAPRVAGFIVVGGALPGRWRSLALPVLHTLTLSAEITVVDQLEVGGAGSPSSILLDEAALERAARLGTNVARQLGRSPHEAKYVGPKGLCPKCHLSVMVIEGREVECATCGAGGRLTVVDGEVEVGFTPEGLARSIISYDEKVDHFHEVQSTAARQAEQRETITRLAEETRAWDPSVRP